MSINNPLEEGQFELFSPASKASIKPTETSRIRIKSLTVSVENVIVSSIIFLMVTVLFFSFGVERGKKVATAVTGSAIENAAAAAQQESENDGIVVLQPKSSEKPQETQVASPQDVVPAVKGTERVIDIAVPVEIAMQVPADTKDLYTIQVASFKLGSSFADKEATSLQKAGHETYILPKGNYSIVCIGKFKAKDEAQKFSKKLKNKYSDLLVRRF